MDSLIAAAARSLAAGDSLSALKRVALREDPPALALRGIAMAQLGEYARARDLLKRAARAFGAKEEVSRARCVVAGAEVALAMRDLSGSSRELASAADKLDAHGDRANALQARLIDLRRLLLIGRLEEAEVALSCLDMGQLPPALTAIGELAAAELALRALRMAPARAALERAQKAAVHSGVPALLAEVAEARAALERPAARRISGGSHQALRLDEVGRLLDSGAMVVDACRREVRAGPASVTLAGRAVLFEIARALAEAWPGDVDRETLILRAFNARRPNETHRARLRVEIGRLRVLVDKIAGIEATPRGFILKAGRAREVVVLAPPIDGDQASVVALLSDGQAWSTSALALALGTSQRTLQRALIELEADGRVRSVGKAKARRWVAPPLAGFTTILLLPAALPFA